MKCGITVTGNKRNAAMATKPADTQGKGIVFADRKKRVYEHIHTHTHRHSHTHFFSKAHPSALVFVPTVALKWNARTLKGAADQNDFEVNYSCKDHYLQYKNHSLLRMWRYYQYCDSVIAKVS